MTVYTTRDGRIFRGPAQALTCLRARAKLPMYQPSYSADGKQLWTKEEVVLLRRGVAKHGFPAWMAILNDPEFVILAATRNGDALRSKWKGLAKQKQPEAHDDQASDGADVASASSMQVDTSGAGDDENDEFEDVIATLQKENGELRASYADMAESYRLTVQRESDWDLYKQEAERVHGEQNKEITAARLELRGLGNRAY